MASVAQTKPPGPSPHPFAQSTKILLWAVLPTLFITLSISSPITGALSLLILAPTLWLIHHNNTRPPPQKTDPETLLWTYVLTGTVGVIAIIIIQSLISYTLALALFQDTTSAFLKEMQRSEDDVASLKPDTLALRREMASQWSYWVFMFLFAFLAAALPEELLKYTGIIYARRRGRVISERDYITLGAASALGFSTIENIGFVYAAAVQQTTNFGKLALTVIERVVLGSPMHMMGGILTAFDASRRDFRGEDISLGRMMLVPVFFHGIWDFSLFGVSALDGNVGWVHPQGKSLVLLLGIAAAILGTLTYVTQKRFESWKAQREKSK
ncbi:protease prsW family-domain-containing protein [Hypoxylon trugodes]|uniref:protease prsW family-domain-containing protein n=1 Tax=Hypoxylon trugodes TaxID=326681 RepID=UPI0021A0FDC1|nr:protease prsW family-domain-containing protein [Hypoxylon trugodes]KAI1383096.1 protease prsW family-domain-containing protein [Hypoxylon trugodes]